MKKNPRTFLRQEIGGMTWQQLLLQAQFSWLDRFEEEDKIVQDFFLARGRYQDLPLLPQDLTFDKESRALFAKRKNQAQWILREQNWEPLYLAQLNCWFWCRWIYKRSEREVKSIMDMLGHQNSFIRDQKVEKFSLEVPLEEFKKNILVLRDRDLKRDMAAMGFRLEEILKEAKNEL